MGKTIDQIVLDLQEREREPMEWDCEVPEVLAIEDEKDENVDLGNFAVIANRESVGWNIEFGDAFRGRHFPEMADTEV